MQEAMPWHANPDMRGLNLIYGPDHAWQEAHYLHATYSAMINILNRRVDINNTIAIYQESNIKFTQIENQIELIETDHIELNLAFNHSASQIAKLQLEAEQLDADRESLDVFVESRLQFALVDWENNRTDNGLEVYEQDKRTLLPLPGEAAWRLISEASIDLQSEDPNSQD
jgi:hypothetical protein